LLISKKKENREERRREGKENKSSDRLKSETNAIMEMRRI